MIQLPLYKLVKIFLNILLRRLKILDHLFKYRITIHQPQLHALLFFNQFEPVSFATLGEIVEHLKPTVCHQDIIPTRIFKQAFSVIGPSVMEIINCCLVSGSVPVYFKHAIVQLLIKKANLDPTVCSNFRPISKLPFFQKCWRK